ncbi:hypothetical protein KQ313_06725 [Synechococcus sp. CS-1325]|uniref:hypothetical protein n=1 Tax=unclassified Synechococcus TaxID=2626047 RepID=UPI000DB61AC7|nr:MULTISPECIES: hypothetical protein [unclassified Synechococcus]PZV02986.1 MAG: hypothetical protein DCF24_00115 [Cyanobium sp.]MCT0199369.1 hypothetical protein [Synechococcus sp. CS-1325]MCT0214426.1 hypothetical protein [Synechococcus sp. CS-1326]MCT0231808.1 hypothetical protein [Synechococcus sp. CS-1324]MCT0233271.1 hypothetical protein [Synechococcus sp. CS-1327]
MGLLDRLLGTGANSGDFSSKKPKAEPAAKKDTASFFLDADASGTLGNVDYMRRPYTIRHTFPGNADSPGQKEIIQQVDSMEARVESASAALTTPAAGKAAKGLNSGVPKPVKKTFAEKLSSSELSRRLRGSTATGVNSQAGEISPRTASSGSPDAQSQVAQQSGKPGTIDPFKSMARDIIS